MESKSGLFKGKVAHYDKVTEAANDLKKKVSGNGGPNDPWKNAYNHASHLDVGARDTIRSQIKSLMKQYESGAYQDISSFNIIPCATIFFTGPIEKESIDLLAAKIKRYFASRNHKGIRVLCVSNAALDGFLSYINLRRDDDE